MTERAVFLDRDNTIIENDGYLGDPSKVKLLPGAGAALTAIRALGYRLIVVSNQSGVARGMFDEAAVEAVNQEMSRQLQEQAGAYVDASYYCPFHPESPIAEYKQDHAWRKPKPGMLRQAAVDFGVDLAQSWMIGDQNRDIGAGAAAGCRTILLRDPDRSGAVETDKETNVSPNYVVRTLADAARIIAREGRSQPAILTGTAAVPAKEPTIITNAPADSVTTTSPLAIPAPVVDEQMIAERVAERINRQMPHATPPMVGGSAKLEKQLEDLLALLRQQHRHADLREDFSRSDIASMILQVLALGALGVGLYDFVSAPVTFKKGDDFFTAQFALLGAVIWLLVGVMLQGVVIALLVRRRNK